jgi:SAM-dependent methyltransferase
MTQAVTRIAFDACPLCGAEDAGEIKIASVRGHPLYDPALPGDIHWVSCDRCGHVFTDGYFDARGLEVLFSRAHRMQTPGVDVERARGVAAKIVEDVGRLRERLGGRWLDVGFGDGALLTTAEEFGYDVVGLDLRTQSVERLRAMGFPAHVAEITSFEPESREKFDVISMADVLEHMPFPKPALARAHALLADDGLLFVSMPNRDSFAWKDLDARDANPYWAELEHLHNFGRRRLYALLEEMGFHPLRYGISQRYVACMEVVARRGTKGR